MQGKEISYCFFVLFADLPLAVILRESGESRNTCSKEKATPPSAVSGLEGIDKRVGSRGKKESKGLNVVLWVIFL